METPDEISTVTIMLGSNTGNRKAMLDAAVEALRRHIVITAETADIDNPDYTGRGNDYLNRVVAATTSLSEAALTAVIKDIEKSHGRNRSLSGIVAIDIDIVTFNDTVINPDEYESLPYRALTSQLPGE